MMNVRKAKKTDAQQLLNLFNKLDSESSFMLFEPGERRTTLQEQETIIELFANSQTRFMFVVEVEDIVGFCVLVGNQQQRNAHVASLVIGVIKSAWRQGIGAMLMSAALAKANEAGITRIELTVRQDNQAAIALYKKFGFVIEGERIAALKIQGQLVNEFFMAKID